jgi:hypothetical protein
MQITPSFVEICGIEANPSKVKHEFSRKVYGCTLGYALCFGLFFGIDSNNAFTE